MAEDRVQRKLAAILAADVAGYSRLMGQDEAGTRARFNAHLDEHIEPAVERAGGRIVKTMGDGLLVEFASVVDAVQCAVGIQAGMADRNAEEPDALRMEFRIGVNLGDVILEGDDIHGDGVNVAARLEGLADPGGICVSQAVLDLVKQKLELRFEDIGDRALKNIEEPVRTYRIASADRPRKLKGTTSESANVLLPVSRRPSLAIMAFRNLNQDPEIDYIADGIGLGIQTLLVQLSGLFFINACFDQAYREGKVTAAEALRELPVRYALEGAVQKAGQRIRVTAQLTDLEESAVVWADRYDRDLEDVFALQDDVTREVITSLSTEVLGADLSRVSIHDLKTEGAWEYFLRGVSHVYKFTRDDNARARTMFEKIHELHPEKPFGPAYVAFTYWLDATRGWTDSLSESIAQASRWAEMSVVSDEASNGLGHVVLGSIRLLEGRHDEALDLCQRGVGFRMNCPFALSQLAAVQNYCGDAGGAVKNAREALAVRTFYPPPLINVLATAYRDNGQTSSSISAASEAARLDPEHTDAFVTLCSDYVFAGKDADARQTADEIIRIDPGFRIAEFAKKQPYKDPEILSRIVEALRTAGLPE